MQENIENFTRTILECITTDPELMTPAEQFLAQHAINNGLAEYVETENGSRLRILEF